MFEGLQPWTEMVAYFIEKNIIKFGNKNVEANWWNVINSNRDVKCAGSMIVNHLLTSWQSMLDLWNDILHKKGDLLIHYKWRFWRHQGY